MKPSWAWAQHMLSKKAMEIPLAIFDCFWYTNVTIHILDSDSLYVAHKHVICTFILLVVWYCNRKLPIRPIHSFDHSIFIPHFAMRLQLVYHCFNSLSFFLCFSCVAWMHLFTCEGTHVCMWVCMSLCVHAGRGSGWTLGVIIHHSFPLLIETGSSHQIQNHR